MRNHYIAFLLCFFGLTLTAQTNKEVVSKKFNSHQTIDTIKCRLLSELIELENDNFTASNYNKLLEKYTQKLPKTDTKKTIQFQTIVLTNKAYFALFESDYQLALKYYFEALKLAEKNNDIESLCTIYNSLGSMFFDLNESEKSFAYYKKASSIALKHNKLKKLGNIYNNIGYNLINSNQLDSGYYYYRKSLNIRRQIGDSLLIMQSIANIGGYYSRKNEYDKAIDLHAQCMNYELKNNDEIGAFSSAGNIAAVYYKKGNIKKAEMYSEKSLALAQKNNYYYGVFNACEQLEIIYGKQNKLNKVIEVLNLKAAAKDSLNESESKEALYKAEFKHETEKKDNEIIKINQAKKITELENKRQKSVLILILCSLIIAAIIGYLLFKRYKTNQQNELLKIQLDETRKTLDAENKSIQSELKALKSQMNPHFIFNALNAIQEQFMYGDKVLANEQMGNFTALTREILNVSGKKSIPIQKEIEILTQYLELEKMRFDKDFQYTIACDPNIDEDYIQIPPMLIQPFAENSIKHGLLHKQGFKELHIKFELNTEETFLICTVTDNGIGRDKAMEIKNKRRYESFSTQAIDQRLKMSHPENTITYTDLKAENNEPLGTSVVIQMKLV